MAGFLVGRDHIRKRKRARGLEAGDRQPPPGYAGAEAFKGIPTGVQGWDLVSLASCYIPLTKASIFAKASPIESTHQSRGW